MLSRAESQAAAMLRRAETEPAAILSRAESRARCYAEPSRKPSQPLY